MTQFGTQYEGSSVCLYNSDVRHKVCFQIHMIGLNMMYAMMIALIPDQVPPQQTGTADGVLALLVVTGSLSEFGHFHFYYLGGQRIQDMFRLYFKVMYCHHHKNLNSIVCT